MNPIQKKKKNEDTHSLQRHISFVGWMGLFMCRQAIGAEKLRITDHTFVGIFHILVAFHMLV